MRFHPIVAVPFVIVASLAYPVDSAALQTATEESAVTIEIESATLAMKAIQHQPTGSDGIAMSSHDAFIYFSRVGHKDAVPVLIKALSEVEYVGNSTAVICTWVHLHEALEAQTGKHFGFDQAAWQKWWDTEGKNLPASYFDPSTHKKSEANQRPDGTPVKSLPSNPGEVSGVPHS